MFTKLHCFLAAIGGTVFLWHAPLPGHSALVPADYGLTREPKYIFLLFSCGYWVLCPSDKERVVPYSGEQGPGENSCQMSLGSLLPGHLDPSPGSPPPLAFFGPH